MIRAICKEAILRKNELDQSIDTIYFGGGTPSLLDNEEIHLLLSTIREHYPVNPDAEITLEANPDDFSAGKPESWKAAGINRLSIGIQSFQDRDLQWMNRAHNSNQAAHSIHAAYAAGITNLSIDLIYGTPGLSEDEWKQNVEQAISFGIPHLSCYALTIEPRTALAGMIRLKKKEQTNADIQARHFELLMDWLQAAGYNHYEISNFALPGHQSRHNSSYWKGEHYLGLGPSAHSFNGSSRQWNISNNALYITGIENNLPNLEKEDLSLLQQLNEYIMISLRTMDGMLLDKITQRWSRQLEIKVLEAAAPWIQSGHLILNGQNLILSKPGKLFADRIASDLFQL